MGNLRSVQKALEAASSADVRLVSSPEALSDAELVVLPGVGAFDHAVEELKNRGLFEPVAEAIKRGTPYLGLCLGLQLLFESSEEGVRPGLGILEGRVVRFKEGLRIPHMGWNRVDFAEDAGMAWARSGYFYFVHSYFAEPADASLTAGTTQYGARFTSVIRRGNILATQFHPEKSQDGGLGFLTSYLKEIQK
ncbi:MAG: imidazole glycerol phosphate synthase subunit HisH [Candidatus Omnitrophica bacterium]|nr:imidazole glycerol phosphate synthase subunit HisH [Candidatus Omnitrophota bacterium]